MTARWVAGRGGAEHTHPRFARVTVADQVDVYDLTVLHTCRAHRHELRAGFARPLDAFVEWRG